jgi:peptidoglycan hydrolase-like protein with peptidoglycan-binding domain
MRRFTALAVAIAAAVATTIVVLQSGGGSGASASTGPVATAAVIRTTLASRQQVSGTLQRAGSYTLVMQQTSGTLSALPAPGTVIRRGQVLYWLDGRPVRLLYGTQAAWRDLVIGDGDGTDVGQLNRNLRALGFTDYGSLTVDDHFDWATAGAIDQWQHAHGVTETGFLPLGSVAFFPGPVRVTAQRAVPGTPMQPGTAVLDLTSTRLVVNVPLDPSLRQLVHVGDRVQIQLPEGQTTPGTVSQIGADTTAAAGGQSAPGASPGGSAAGAGASAQGAGDPSSQTGTAGPASVPVTVSLDRPGDARGLDQVPVQVAITDTVHHNVLAVPIGALLALANGGYAVAVDQGATRTLIGVTPGVFDGNRVEVASSRLQPGMRVEVASS